MPNLPVTLALATLLGLPGCSRAESPPPPSPATSPAAEPTPSAVAASRAWPSPLAPLAATPLQFPTEFGRKRIFLDAGHGAPGNEGNRSVWCEAEQDSTLRTALDLARRLEATGHFRVRLSRAHGQSVAYPERLQAAERWRADAFVSLHTDARGEAYTWRAAPEQWCLRNDLSPGYSVLWADDGPEHLLPRRLSLARALAHRMQLAGFLPYNGVDYVGLYEADAQQPGVFVSRHQPGQRIFLLRRPRIPSVIIETHHALDLEEDARWREERTLEAFAVAVAQGLVQALAPPG